VRHEREALEESKRQLALQKEREIATHRALLRARLVAAVASVLMLAAAGSAVFGFINLRRARVAERQTEAARHLAEQARAESEKLVGFLLEDFYQELMPTGQVEIVGKLADKAVTYYDGLPAELMSPRTRLYRGWRWCERRVRSTRPARSPKPRMSPTRRRKSSKTCGPPATRATRVATALALAIFAKTSLGGLRDSRSELEKGVGLLRPVVASGRATRSAKLALGDMLQYLAHSEPRPEDGLTDCIESREILAGMGALDLSDLTAASIYGDVTDTQSRMAQRLGRLDDAEKLSAIVSDIAEKVLEQRPGDLRAMKNRYFSANMQGMAAVGPA